MVFTAGFKPPYSINLLMGQAEALFASLINLVGFLGGLYLFKELKKQGIYTMMIYLIFTMALNVIIMTRDIFNLFVFMEVMSIAVVGLVIFDKNFRATQAGFKYLIATGVIAGIFLIAITFAYYFSGTLNIDTLIRSNMISVKAGAVTAFLLMIAIVLELKPFPANGWALDLYEGAIPGVSALLSAASASAMLFALYKLSPLASASLMHVLSVIGIVTFIGSNLLGIKRTNPNRLLGYSSIGQIGLLTAIIGLSPVLGGKFAFIAIMLLVSHSLAKAGLFWLSGILHAKHMPDWADLPEKTFAAGAFWNFYPYPDRISAFPLFLRQIGADHAIIGFRSDGVGCPYSGRFLSGGNLPVSLARFCYKIGSFQPS